MAEIRAILRVKFKSELPKLDLMEELILSICDLVDPKMRIKYILKDPDDDKILECATEEKADFIISENSHLLKIKQYNGIKIVKARELLENFLT